MATAQQQIKDCLTDQEWRLNNLYRITTKDGKEIQFRMNAAQADFYHNMWHINVILKSRQMGFSTFIQILMLDMCLFFRNTDCGIIAQSREDAEKIFDGKIKFAYDRLPREIAATVKATSDSVRELKFDNASKIRVGTSMRSGTLQALHVSEYGKIGAKYPAKAKEIKTGALNTVQAGQYIFIESTAEGRGGEFHDLVMQARKLQDSGTKLTTLDPRFFFYAWHEDPTCVLPHAGVNIPQEYKDYFEKLEEDHGITLTRDQKAFYVKKSQQQGDDMKREYPSTPDEPFEVAVEGAYFARQMARVRKEGRIIKLPVETRVPVNTFWDLGRNDLNSIWLHQRVAKEDRFIGYYQNSGESLAHYVTWLLDWLPADVRWGTHYLPHDASVTDLSRTDNLTREQVINDLGLHSTQIVSRIEDINTGIELTRQAFPTAWFDESACSEGLDSLDNYRREWNEQLETWRDRPRHDIYSNGADAFRQWAQGYKDESMGWTAADVDKIMKRNARGRVL